MPVAPAAAAPEHTDVMFVFDTSGSMSGELSEAKEKILEVMQHVKANLPDVAFGVASVEDIPDYSGGAFSQTLTEEEYEQNPEKPWRLDQPVTTEESQVVSAIGGLTIGGGGDGPEAYSRALWETNTNPTVGWRANAHHEIVLVADNVPHDPNLNEGVPENEWATNEETDQVENPFDSFEEPPGRWGIPSTAWAPGVNLSIQSVASELGVDGKPLESVEFYGAEDGYLPYWEYWAGLSGGEALDGNSGELEPKLISAIETGADKPLPACPATQTRDAEGVCIEELPTIPASETWKGPALERNVSVPIPSVVISRLTVGDSVTPSATASDTLLPPSLNPDLPFSVGVRTSAGEVTLSLVTGATSGSPAGVSAAPPFPQLFNLAAPSAKELLDAIHPQGGWFAIPLGKASRSVTLTLADISPSSFAAMLDDDLAAKYELNEFELKALAVAAGIAVVAVGLTGDAAVVAAELAVDGVSVATGAVLNAIRSVIIPALEDAATTLVTSIPVDLLGDAGKTWHSLTRLAASIAAAHEGTAPAVEGPPTGPAQVLELRARDLRGLESQLLRGALAKAARASLLTLPARTILGPLVVSKRVPHGGGALTLVGGNLPGTRAQLVITGPGYAAVRDVRVAKGLAGGRIVLPRGRRAGRWYAGIIDYGSLHASHGRLTGHAILEAASWATTR
ncbi:MAG TPA: hypothetical protein VNU24_05075 [Solirubrobacteraceae bacterium]|nr:hypothetical protein [Solirubrobacteraceae bacterium]